MLKVSVPSPRLLAAAAVGLGVLVSLGALGGVSGGAAGREGGWVLALLVLSAAITAIAQQTLP